MFRMVLFLSLVCGVCFGDILDPLPDSAFLEALLVLLQGLSGATSLGIALLVSQTVMVLFRTRLANFAGIWKITIVAGLNVVVTVLGHLVSGLEIWPALFSATTFAAIQVFVNELVKHFNEAKRNLPAV